MMGRTILDVRSKKGVQVRLPIDEHIQIRLMFEKMMFETVRWIILLI